MEGDSEINNKNTNIDVINQDEFISEAKEFFEVNKKEISKELRANGKAISIDFKDLSAYVPELAGNLIDRPEETVQLLEVALEELAWTPSDIRVRIINLSSTQHLNIRNLRSKHLGKLISINGMIRRASEIRPLVTNVKFECPSCGTVISVLQIEREEKQPSRCSCGRRGGFKEISKDMVDSQVLVIEENLDDIEEAGAQPKRINIFLSEDLTDPKMERRIIPGSRVQIIGILKEIRIKSGPSNLNRYDIAIEANNIIPLDEDVSEMEISEEDEEEIKKISLKSDLIEFLSRSIAPSICGYQEVKKALVLQLFGGVNRKRTDGSFCREQIHGLLVGDPGTSKSIILKYISEISYKGRYVSGKSTTAAGITATAIFDENTKAWCLEAGAIVLANKGSIFIDEFDKMDKNDRSNLHEAMEQGTITISKATIQATLSAKTSVLAAANPKFSRFEENSPIGNQINLPPSLLSRFDFIFIMKDLPEEIRDTEIADKIIGEHSEKEVLDILDIKLFKKYIAYAKQFKPDLTKECTNRLKEYYVNLRKRSKRIEGKKIIPLGARQFEGLIRLSEASAKLRLQKTVTKENADEAIEIMETYLRQVGYDEEHDTFDIDKISGNSASQRSKIDLILSTIKELKNQWGKSIEIEVLRSKIGDKINVDEFDEIVEKLIRMGELFRPTRGIIQLI